MLHGRLAGIRPVRPEDLDALVAIVREPAVLRWFGEDTDDELRATLLPSPSETPVHPFVIEHEGKIVGWIQCWEQPLEGYRHAGIDLCVTTELHGRGVGVDAIRTVARWAFDTLGHHRLTIDPAATNERAIRAYEKVGFRRVGVMRQYEQGADGTFHDGLLMEMLRDDLRDTLPPT